MIRKIIEDIKYKHSIRSLHFALMWHLEWLKTKSVCFILSYDFNIYEFNSPHNEMTVRRRLSASTNNCSDANEFSTLHFDKVCNELANMVYDGKRLKWINDFDSLKKTIEEFLDLRGKWSSPGGGSKRFKSTNVKLNITWYHKKEDTATVSKQGWKFPTREMYTRLSDERFLKTKVT